VIGWLQRLANAILGRVPGKVGRFDTAMRIPIQSGQGFRFDVGRRSDLMSATIPK